MYFEFRNGQTHEICCSGHDKMYLCDDCKARAAAVVAGARSASPRSAGFAVGDEVSIEKPGDALDGETGTVSSIDDSGVITIVDESGESLGSFNESELRAAVLSIVDVPDPYHEANARAAKAAASATDDPDYQPFGTPPDGYAIAIQRSQKTRIH